MLPRVFLSVYEYGSIANLMFSLFTQHLAAFCSLSTLAKQLTVCGCFVPQVYDRLVHRLQLGQGINAPGL